MSDKDFLSRIIKEEKLDEKTANFLMKYLSAWLNNQGIDLNMETITMLNENKDIIDKLKIEYAKEKILDITERKIILSDIASGKKIIEQARITQGVVNYVQVEPTFGERINAINALNDLDKENKENDFEKILIIDDINDDNSKYEKEELDE